MRLLVLTWASRQRSCDTLGGAHRPLVPGMSRIHMIRCSHGLGQAIVYVLFSCSSSGENGRTRCARRVAGGLIMAE